MDNSKNVKSKTVKQVVNYHSENEDTSKVKETVTMAKLLVKWGMKLRMRETDEALEVNGKIVDNSFYDDILLDFYDEGYKTQHIVNGVVRRVARKNYFNPVHDYLGMCLNKYDGKDYVKELSTYFTDAHTPIRYEDGTLKTVFHAFFYRWGIGAIGKAYNITRPSPKQFWQNPVLILGGEQGLGKSDFVAWLASNIPEMFLEDQINPEGKELDRQLASHWLVEMSEAVTTFNRADQNALKFKITQKMLSFRKPWDREMTEKPNLACLIGTFNPDGTGIFNDATGTRRWLLCELNRIDWGYERVDIDGVWGQLMHDYAHGATNVLSPEEKSAQVSNADGQQREMPLEEYINRFFIIDKTETNFYLHTYQIKDELKKAGYKFSTEQALNMEVGKVLNKYKLEKAKRDNQNGYVGIRFNPNTTSADFDTTSKTLVNMNK